MTFLAFILITGSVLLHALWHFISKSSHPTIAFFLPVSFAVVLTGMPLLLYSGIRPGELPASVLLFVLGGGLFGVLGDIGLSYAYRFADISQAYPMARALPVLLTAGITGACGFGKPLSCWGITGMIIIFTGCVLLPLANAEKIQWKAFYNKGMLGILLAAVATTGYTITDSFGVQNILRYAPEAGQLGGAGTYSCLREMVLASGLTLYLLIFDRRSLCSIGREFAKPQSYLAGFFAASAYIMILIAMAHVTNVSYVQAFRQLSLPISVLLGVVILKEKITVFKVAAIGMILGGLLIIYLG